MPFNILKNKKYLIGFDPKLFTQKTIQIFFGKTNCKFKPLNKNLVDEIWKRKIPSIKKKYFKLPEKSVSESYNSKVNQISNYLKKRKADYLFVSASENNAWLLNIRGHDTKYSPIPNCHLLIDRNKNINFYCDLKKISSSLKKYLSKVKFFNFKNIDKNLSAIYGKKFIIDKNSCSFFFEEIISKNNSGATSSYQLLVETSFTIINKDKKNNFLFTEKINIENNANKVVTDVIIVRAKVSLIDKFAISLISNL